MKNLNDKILHSGLDHLEIYGTFNHEIELFDVLDFDNSNYGELEDYIFTKLHTDHKFEYQVTFTKENYTLFNYIKGKQDANIPTKDYIIIYSTALKLLTDEEIIYFIEGYFTLKKCRRFDICIDLKENLKKVLSNFKEIKQKGAEFYDEKGKIATKYIGEKKNTQNKRSLIRIYNKLLDIIAKKKLKLYQEYLYEKDVTRVEVEIRQELAKNLHYSQVFDVNFLKQIFKNYISKHTNMFDKLKGEKITLYRKPVTSINPEDYQGMSYKLKRTKTFVGHAKSMYNLGFCPIRVLVGEGLYQDKTKLAFGGDLLEIILERENILKQRIKEDKYLRHKKYTLPANYEKNDS